MEISLQWCKDRMTSDPWLQRGAEDLLFGAPGFLRPEPTGFCRVRVKSSVSPRIAARRNWQLTCHRLRGICIIISARLPSRSLRKVLPSNDFLSTLLRKGFEGPYPCSRSRRKEAPAAKIQIVFQQPVYPPGEDAHDRLLYPSSDAAGLVAMRQLPQIFVPPVY